jgi:hypothetical protein
MMEQETPRMWDVVTFDDGDIQRRGRVVGVSDDGTLTVMGSSNHGFQVSSDAATVEARPA